jgi:hypothetical protein
MGGDRRNLQAGGLVAAIGAVMLFVSLFLDWYQPGLTAWRTLEVLDLVLAAAALAALAASVAGLGREGPVPARWLPALGLLATVIVVGALLNHPPAADGLPTDTGIWFALAGALMLLVGGALAVARVSIAISWERSAAPAAAGPDGTGEPTEREAPAADAVEPAPAAEDPPTQRLSPY